MKCSGVSGLTPERCDEVFRLMVDVIGRTLKRGERVMIEGFGSFYTDGQIRKGHRTFWPAKSLLDRLDAQGPVAQSPGSRARILRSKRLPLRPEDAQIIEQWLLARKGAAIERVTPDLLYKDRGGQIQYWADSTIALARRSVLAFARRCPVPLLKVGLTGDAGDIGLYDSSELRREVLAYAEDYQARALPKLDRYLRSKYGEEDQVRNRGPIVWRTPAWKHFVVYTSDFYNWLEQQGLRPPGSNPLAGIRKFNPIQAGKILIVTERYFQILDYPNLSPLEAAAVYLLANGLRASEVGRAKMEQLSLRRGTITIEGKGGKVRTIVLYPKTISVLDGYLQHRRFSASPWLFPARMGEPRDEISIWQLVRRIASKVFPYQDQVKIRKSIHPHGFRHFYVTESLRRGVNPAVLIRQVGHASIAMLDRYTTVTEDDVRKEVAKAAKKGWL